MVKLTNTQWLIISQPLGVVGQIIPGISLLMAAGNYSCMAAESVVMKPQSKLRRLFSLMEKWRFMPAGVVNTSCYGAEAGQAGNKYPMPK